MNKYEAMFILAPSLGAEELARIRESLSAEIKQNEAEVENAQDLGKKKLAFSIKKQKEGFYCLIDFKGNPAIVKKLNNSYRLNESILRVLITRKD